MMENSKPGPGVGTARERGRIHSSALNQPTSPSFLITVDTEGDNIWARPKRITTQNSAYLPRFQALCEEYSFKPSYLTNYEMVTDPQFVEFGKDILKRHTGEIGMHLHSWNSPPVAPLTKDDFHHQPYLVEFPEEMIKEKVGFLTNALEEAFQTKMTSHRAGRWALNEYYAKVLVEEGYLVDCSVTPHVSWQATPGDPSQKGGSNFFDCPTSQYLVSLNNICQPGNSTLLEVPVTIIDTIPSSLRWLKRNFRRTSFLYRAVNKVYPTLWLRARDGNRMLRLLEHVEETAADYLMFTLHSSELMPGGSPSFQTESDIENLYAVMEEVFGLISTRFTGRTLTEFYHLAAKGSPSN